MAFLRTVKQGKRTYFYVVRSIRRDDRVRQTVLEYLGRDPDPKRLKRALRYWGVKPKSAKRKRGA